MQINFTTESFDSNFSIASSIVKSGFQRSERKPPEDKDEPVTENRSQDEKLQKLQSVLEEHGISLKFSEDETTKQLVIELVDDKTGDSIRQMPSEVSLKLSAMFVKTQGQFLDEKV